MENKNTILEGMYRALDRAQQLREQQEAAAKAAAEAEKELALQVYYKEQAVQAEEKAKLAAVRLAGAKRSIAVADVEYKGYVEQAKKSNGLLGASIGEMFGAGKTLLSTLGGNIKARFKSLYAKVDKNIFDIQLDNEIELQNEKIQNSKIEMGTKLVEIDSANMDAEHFKGTLGVIVSNMSLNPSVDELRSALAAKEKMTELYASVERATTTIANDKEIIKNAEDEIYNLGVKEIHKETIATRAKEQVEDSNVNLAKATAMTTGVAKGLAGNLKGSAGANIGRVVAGIKTASKKYELTEEINDAKIELDYQEWVRSSNQAKLKDEFTK